MTVKELKEALEEYHETMEVVDFMGEPIEKVTLYYDHEDNAKCQVY